MEYAYGFQQHVATVYPKLNDASSGIVSFPTGLRPVFERDLWQHRTKSVSEFIAHGYIHIILSVISLLLLLFRDSAYLVVWYRKRHRSYTSLNPRPTRLSRPLAHVITKCVLQGVVFSISVVQTSKKKEWKQTSTLAYVFLLDLLELISGFRPQYVHHTNTLLVAITTLAILEYLLPLGILGSTHRVDELNVAKLSCLAIALLIAFVTPRLWRDVDLDLKPACKEDGKEAAPEELCSYLSYYMSYEWITYLILRGCRRDLTIDDLPPLPQYDDPRTWLKKIKVSRAKAGGKTLSTLTRLLKKQIWRMVFWSSSTALVEYIAPFAMFRLLGYLEDPSSAIIHPAVWIALLFLGPMARSVSYQQYIFTSTRLLVRVNMSLVQEIYSTALQSFVFDGSVAKSSKAAETAGLNNIASLMSYDVDAIWQSRDIVFVSVAGTTSLTIALAFLYSLLGWSSLVGICVMFLLTPLPALLSRRMSRIQRTVMAATDQRLSKIAEALNLIRAIKYFGWEEAMAATIDRIRATEQARIWARNILGALLAMAGDLLPLISLLAMFSTYILATHQPLHAPAAFASLAIVETLRAQFVWLSNVSRWTANGIISLRRIDYFFRTAESLKIKKHPEGPPKMSHATFLRSPVAAFRLQDITVTFQPRRFNVITGPTGSGKTSLLLSLLGETVHESGTVTCPHSVAYVPQTAWLLNDTVRGNILFHGAFEPVRYSTVLAACGLLHDIAQLPDGDMTQVGEKGSSLSGGQRQRISLARALYSKAETLLLDDIFSALDTHTTAIVYDACFGSKGMLIGRTVILVTHLSKALEDADLVVRLEQGMVTAIEECRKEQNNVTSKPGKEHGIQSVVEISEIHDNDLTSPALSQSQEIDDNHKERRLKTETVAKGRIPRTLVLKYMFLFGGSPYVFLALFSSLMVQVAFFSITYWLSVWTNSSTSSLDLTTGLSIYAATVVTFLSLQGFNNILYQNGGWRAARTMHGRLVKAIFAAPVAWFDENPIGRALNRFGKDTSSMDTVLVDWLRMSLDNGIRFLLRIAGIASIMPIFAAPAACVCALGFAIGEMYTRAQVSVKRLCSVSYSPVFALFTDTLAGLIPIRASSMDEIFQEILADRLATFSRAAEAQYNCNRWVSVRSDLCAASVSVAAGIVAYIKSGTGSVSPGLVGFSLTNAIGLSQTILTLVRNMNELEVEMNSFQRMREYAAIPPEDDASHASTSEGVEMAGHVQNPIPEQWPKSGQVDFSCLTVGYAVSKEPVLRDISFRISSGERVAIVGRTGSGKSTLGLSLLRFTKTFSGNISIDGVDISKVPLTRLRRQLTVIPQEPVLFSGDVRFNLDPFGERDEGTLQRALNECVEVLNQSDDEIAGDEYLTPTETSSANTLISSTPPRITLDTPVAANGENFSQGQRQVLGLARTLSKPVSQTRVIILDEATASVDHDTDVRIQALLRRTFPHSTILAIAHRLRTVMDYDKVIVMGGGKILEAGTPRDLLLRRQVFWDMVARSGEAEDLLRMVDALR